jgi:hypothetical protein
MLMGKIWGTKIPRPLGKKSEKAGGFRPSVVPLDPGKAKRRQVGRRIGQASLWSMIVVVGGVGILFVFNSVMRATGTEIPGDSSSGSNGLLDTLKYLALALVVVSHILVFVCDALTDGDAREALWALAVFWGGGFLVLLVFSAVSVFLS